MKKRRFISFLAGAVLLALAGTGAALAYFTDEAQLSHTVRMGHVELALTENQVEYDAETREWVSLPGTESVTEEGLQFTHVLPGMTVPKNPTVTLKDGSVDAYVRVFLEIQGADGITAEDLACFEEAVRESIAAEPGWYYQPSEGCYYYEQPLQAGQQAVLFRQVTIPAQWGNNTVQQTVTVRLYAEAVQADYFTPETNAAGQITGWGTEMAGSDQTEEGGR